jgi:hypothetical protein
MGWGRFAMRRKRHRAAVRPGTFEPHQGPSSKSLLTRFEIKVTWKVER